MVEEKCRRCGCSDTYLAEKGRHIGVYCANCNSWIKWTSKNNYESFKQNENTLGALENIELQLNDNYLDLGLFEEEELRIVKNAIYEFKQKYNLLY